MSQWSQLKDIGGKPAWAVYADLTRGYGAGPSGSYGNPASERTLGNPNAPAGAGGESFQEGINRYLKDMPGDPNAIYEAQMGPVRKDIQDRIDQTGLGLQSVSARTGQNYADLMSRYLPEAFKPMGQAASIASGQAQQFSQQRYQMAAQLSQAEKMMEWDKQKFYDQLKATAENLQKELSSRERLAMSQANSAREQAMIQANFQMERERLAQQMQWQAMQFQQAQQNWRASQQLQMYDKYYGQQAQGQYRNDILQGSQLWQNQLRNQPTFAEPAPNESFYQDDAGVWRQSGPSSYPSYDVTYPAPYWTGGYGSH